MNKSFTILKMTLILCLVYFILTYCKFKFVKTYNNANITITAHSGCNGNEPNSIASLESGYKSGANILEIDLYFDKNGISYLSHEELKGNEIKLEEAFKFLTNNSDVKGNIDVKKVDNMPAVFYLIKLYKLSDRVFFTGVNETFVKAVRNGCPGIPYYLNYKPKFLKINNQQYINELVNIVKKNGAIGINIHHYYLNEKLVKTFHDEGLLVSVWTVNNENCMHRAIYYGPDNITTKSPFKLMQLIEKMRLIKKY